MNSSGVFIFWSNDLLSGPLSGDGPHSALHADCYRLKEKIRLYPSTSAATKQTLRVNRHQDLGLLVALVAHVSFSFQNLNGPPLPTTSAM